MKKYIDMMMAKWFCCHEWKEMDKCEIYEDGHELPYKVTFTYVCTKCGKFQQIDS